MNSNSSASKNNDEYKFLFFCKKCNREAWTKVSVKSVMQICGICWYNMSEWEQAWWIVKAKEDK